MASGLMTKQAAWLAGVLAMLVLGFTFAGEPRAQTQTTQVAVRNFEIIAVDGNHLILRDERGTSDYFVPADFEFTVDGKKMTVADLKAGMKGQATVTTTTTITPVTVTELRNGVVLGTGFNSVIVLDEVQYTCRALRDPTAAIWCLLYCQRACIVLRLSVQQQ